MDNNNKAFLDQVHSEKKRDRSRGGGQDELTGKWKLIYRTGERLRMGPIFLVRNREPL